MLAPPSGCAFRPRCALLGRDLRSRGARAPARRAARPARGVPLQRAAHRPLGPRPMSAVVEESTAAEGAAHAPVLTVEHLVKNFTCGAPRASRTVKGTVQAVSDVSFSIDAGQTLGLVGESGSGKSTIGRCVLRLIEPTSGSVKFRGTELTTTRQGASCAQLRREMQIVFQDPYASLDPRMTVGSAIAEPLGASQGARRSPGAGRGAAGARRAEPRARQPLPARVLGRPAPAHRHRPRARARPALLVLDEPVSALDVSIQAGVVNLLEDLQDAPRARVPVHRARPLGRAPHLRHRRGDVPRQDRRDRPVARPLQQGRPSVHAGVAVGGAPSRTRSGSASASASCSKATCRARSTRRAAAGSAPGAGRPRRSARPRSPRSIDRGQGHPVACHFAEVAAEIV